MAYTTYTGGGQRLEMRTGEDARDLGTRNKNAAQYLARKEWKYLKAMHYMVCAFMIIVFGVAIAYILID